MNLQSFSREKLAANFESIPFAPEDRLTVAAARELFNELPISCAEACCSFIYSEEFYKRACSSLAVFGCRTEEHGRSFKRTFFEVRAAQDLLQKTMTLSRAIAENIFTLKLSACPRDFPLDDVCSQLLNLNRLDVKYDLASSISRASLDSVPRALHVSSNLVSLTMQDAFLTDNDVATVFENGSCANDTILHLNLAHNKITSSGLAVVVKKFLATPSSVLCSLDMMGNKIDSEGGSVIGLGLAENESLLSLNLRLNCLDDLGGGALLDCLLTNATLKYLNVSANNLASRSANALVNVLERNDSLSLEAVIITSNPFNKKDVEAIKSCNKCHVDVRGGSSPGRQEMFLGESLMPL
ncbi:hypothetical protein ACHAWT_006027 [Skeletonema menzelii]